MTVALAPCFERWCTVRIDGPFFVPMDQDLPGSVCDLLRRGEQGIVLDLSTVSFIDAAGVGQLVRAYNVACGMDVPLRVVHTTRWVRETLSRVGLFDLLRGEGGSGSDGRDAASAPPSTRREAGAQTCLQETQEQLAVGVGRT